MVIASLDGKPVLKTDWINGIVMRVAAGFPGEYSGSNGTIDAIGLHGQ